MRRICTLALATELLLHFASPLTAQSTRRFVDDSLVNYEVRSSTQLRRLDNGDFVVGPLTSSTTITRISADQRATHRLALRGGGPGEQSGRLVVATATGQRTVVVANELNRTTVYAGNGSVERATVSIMAPDGTGLCGQRILISGMHNGGSSGLSEGVFEVDSERRVRLLQSTKRGRANRPTLGSTDMMAVRRDRLIAAIPSRAELVVSDSGCRTFHTVSVQLAWFLPWDVFDPSIPFVKPIQPRVIGARWVSDELAAMLILRAYRGAKYEAPPQEARPVPRGNGPWAETVLVLVDTRTGRVNSEQVLSQHDWRFASDSEVVAHTLNGEERSGLMMQRIQPSRVR